jgi:hypothetical protein
MVEYLVKLDIEKILYDLFQETQKKKQKYSNIEQELKRLIQIFSGKDTFKANSNCNNSDL